MILKRRGLPLVLLAGLAVAGCGGSDGGGPDGGGDAPAAAAAGTGACPDRLEPLLTADEAAKGEITVAIDQSGSYWNSTSAEARIKPQIEAVVANAVEQSRALRVITFTGTASGAQTVFACSNLLPAHNNEAALAQKQRYVAQQAAAELWTQLTAARAQPAPSAPGTSIVGGWLAVAQSTPLAPDGSPRDAVMLTDGAGLPEQAVKVDLSAFSGVQMHGIGAVDGAPWTTERTAKTIDEWAEWLRGSGVPSPEVSSQSYV
ncbi:hypothetical protein [Motilibacter aurantiacus]|uniref:hypothetical protein n=1 Tax=Motilibacter aurantiacus TaxID=2714955 RepID=UPI00140B4A02|nr:hypothetical protein [Motilibacter aurantiacus]NHC44693.1 hypothetical protein [Motilibacter aurantiacus]